MISASSMQDLRYLPTAESSISRGVSRALVKRACLRLIKKGCCSPATKPSCIKLSLLVLVFFGLAISPERRPLVLHGQCGRQRRTAPVVVLPTAGGPARILFRGDYSTSIAAMGDWTRDGKYVLAVAEETKSLRRVWAFPVDGGEPRKLDIVFESICDRRPFARRQATRLYRQPDEGLRSGRSRICCVYAKISN